MMYCPCFVLHLFLYKTFCLWEGVLGIECGVMKYSLKRYNWSVCLSVHVMENLWSRFFCVVVLYVRPSPFISLFEYRKPFLII